MKRHKRAVILLLAAAAAAVFAGCSAAHPVHTGPAPTPTPEVTLSPPPSVTPEPSPSPDPSPVPSPTLLEDAVPLGSNVYTVPNGEIEGLESPALLDFGGDLLAAGVSYDSPQGPTVDLRLISSADGTLLGSATLPTSGYAHVQPAGDRVAVCDAGRGEVLILDGALNLLTTHTLAPSDEFRCLSRDLSTVYTLSFQQGITAEDLETGECRTLLDGVGNLYVCTVTAEYAAFSYVDLTDQKTTSALLELDTGAILPIPTEDSRTAVYRAGGDCWLLDSGDGSPPLLFTGEGQAALDPAEGSFSLLPRGDLLRQSSSGVLSLHTLSGAHLSTCQLPREEGLYTGNDFLWSGEYGGYFFLSYRNSRTGTLTFWDIGAATEGEDLVLSDPEEKIPGGVTADPALYLRAEELSRRFDVDIRIADQCVLDYGVHSAEAVEDTATLTAALDIMERALSAYPDGFFTQLPYGNLRTVRFELVGTIATHDGERIGQRGGFALDRTDHYLVVMDAELISERIVYHEISHVIDARLEWDAGLRPGALYSEEGWLALQPEGFAYAGTYGELSPQVLAFVDSGYFVRDYACRFATEDRATVMEAAMTDYLYIFEENPHLYPKLEYYSACIRDCFDTEGWPEVTAWEEMLRNDRG